MSSISSNHSPLSFLTLEMKLELLFCLTVAWKNVVLASWNLIHFTVDSLCQESHSHANSRAWDAFASCILILDNWSLCYNNSLANKFLAATLTLCEIFQNLSLFHYQRCFLTSISLLKNFYMPTPSMVLCQTFLTNGQNSQWPLHTLKKSETWSNCKESTIIYK